MPPNSYTRQDQKGMEYYKQIVDLANVAILKFNKDLIIIDFTGNSEVIFGYRKEEVIGRHLSETIVPEIESTGRNLGKLINDLIFDTKSYEYNINENIRKDGKRLWMQWYNREIIDESGNVDGVLSIGIDISDRINAEIALRQSEERFKTLSNLTTEGILIHEKGIIHDCNLSLERQIGYNREELIGENLFDKIVPKKYHKKMVEMFNHSYMQYEAEAIHKCGTVIPISIESRNVKIGDKIVRVAAIRDISELKKTITELDKFKNHLEKLVLKRTQKLKLKSKKIEKLNKELQGSNMKLEELNKYLEENKEELETALEQLKNAQQHLVQSEKMASLGVLLAGIAHEINNPVNFVYAGVNSIMKDFDDIHVVIEKVIGLSGSNIDENVVNEIVKLKGEREFVQAYHAMIETLKDIKLGANRISEIIAGLNKFSRLESEEWRTADLHEEIESVLVLLKNKYKHHIEIVRKYSDNLPLVECYPSKMNQVFMNIINNAIDAIDNNQGYITITTGSEADEAIVSIKDSGKGITNEDKLKIFDPFYTTKEIGMGMGLGLAISYSIIKEHNGEIVINPDFKNGAEFIIKIPLKQH